jgi:hypothetical protein
MINILEILISDIRSIDNLMSLRKVMVIVTKLNDPKYFKKKELKFNLIKIFKLSVYLISILEENKNKKSKREYKDFFRDLIVWVNIYI